MGPRALTHSNRAVGERARSSASCTGAITLKHRWYHRASAALERHLPEQRLFLRSDTGTRFVRLRPWTQLVVIAFSAVLVAWTIVASAILMIDAIGSGDAQEQARLSTIAFESRLDSLSKERDLRATEAAAAQDRFSVALTQVSQMQSALLQSEQRRRELETGIGLIGTTLRTAITTRDAALAEVARVNGGQGAKIGKAGSAADVTKTLAIMTDALDTTAHERDDQARAADAARTEAEQTALDLKLLQERHDEIFTQLEDAVTVSMQPLDKVFTSVGIDPKSLISEVRRGYSGQGGPVGALMPALPADSSPDAKADYARAARILAGLDDMNLYRIAIENSPLAMPLKTAFRFTSGFGRRWGRMHEGLDLAGSYGAPIYATGDGVVSHAGWENGYGNMVEITHPYGLKTRYGHLSAVRVQMGQRVSRGDRIGDMGSTGHSTGTHLHYEVRFGDRAVDPMSFIKAATNVF